MSARTKRLIVRVSVTINAAWLAVSVGMIIASHHASHLAVARVLIATTGALCGLGYLRSMRGQR